MTPNPLSKVTVAFISVSRPQELSWDEELGGCVEVVRGGSAGGGIMFPGI